MHVTTSTATMMMTTTTMSTSYQQPTTAQLSKQNRRDHIKSAGMEQKFKIWEIYCTMTKNRSPLLLVVAAVQLSMTRTALDGDGESLVPRVQRQVYLCGTWPNQFYSSVPCQQPTCPNNGRYLNVGCTFSAQCTPYYSGVSTCINGCCCTVPSSNPSPPPSTSNFGICPSGQLSEVRCSGRGQCASGQSCLGGLCCTNTGDEWNVACGGTRSLSACSSSGACSTGVCTASNYCCECAVGRSAGACSNGRCPTGFACLNGFCCASCAGSVMPFGQCVAQACGGGRRCQHGNICC